MDFIITVLVVIGYWFIKFRSAEDILKEDNVELEVSKVIPIGSNLMLRREPQAFEKIVRELKLIQ